ncbi:MAG TPA: polysaccharide deacetylase family protein [Gaiellaceae bacterium]|jgi:peptidoglycan/xylan/chitin deacetylase (PgdA/CDA1 family)
MARRLAAFAALLALAGGIAGVVFLARDSGTAGNGAAPPPKPEPEPHRARAPAHPRPRPRVVPGPHEQPVPILMYHVIAQASSTVSYPDLFVPPAELANEVAWLAAHGYHGVTLGQVFAYWRRGVALPPKPIVFSFDDGYLSQYSVALPALQRHHWPGVLNLVVEHVGPGNLRPWEVRRLIAAGWEIDSHTISHADLTTLDPERLRDEVAGSRARLRQMFGQPVRFFCYPSGKYDAAVVAAVKAAGYLGATTTNEGLGSPSRPFTLDRLRIMPGEGAQGLAEKLRQLSSRP